MRGNHIHWGRQDYVEPAAMSDEQRMKISSVLIAPREGFKTWNAVSRDGVLLGYVSTRTGGQYWRTTDMDDWMPAAKDWNDLDPKHGWAILRLLQSLDEESQS